MLGCTDCISEDGLSTQRVLKSRGELRLRLISRTSFHAEHQREVRHESSRIEGMPIVYSM